MTIIKITFIDNQNISIFTIKNISNFNIYKSLCNLFDKNNKTIISEFKNLINNFIINKQSYNKYITISLFNDYFIYEELNSLHQLVNIKKHFLNKNKTNCLDDFINKGLNSNLYSINKLIEDIKERKYFRDNAEQYHQTSCYEQDFYQIIKIKHIVNKISDLLNKEIEHLSDKYTKLN